jgi:CBS domain-containing protein
VADAMIRGRIHRVFVTRDEKLVGIITTMDMLKIIRDMGT